MMQMQDLFQHPEKNEKLCDRRRDDERSVVALI